MRLHEQKTIAAGFAAAAALAVVAFGCSKSSNMVIGPSANSSPMAATNVAGTWTGTFQSDSGRCSDPAASANLQQNGAMVTGTLTAAACGVSGNFKGEMAGVMLTGSIAMQGCTGGAVAGSVNGPAISLTVGDILKPLIMGDQVVMYGGSLTLRR